MIYVPDKEAYKCYVVQNEDVIRAYKEVPSSYSSTNYRDYYINSNYIFKDGYQSWGNTSNLPICLSNNNITSSVYYRQDFDKAMIIFLVLVIFCIYLPLKIFSRLFKRGGF